MSFIERHFTVDMLLTRSLSLAYLMLVFRRIFSEVTPAIKLYLSTLFILPDTRCMSFTNWLLAGDALTWHVSQ